MDQSKDKMMQFIAHLMSNDNVRNEPILNAEQLIINFISKNLPVLKQTLTSPQFFPDLSIEDTLQLLLSALRDKVLDETKPEMYKYIENINFNALNSIEGSETIAQEFLKEKFIQFLDVILTHKEVRHHSNCILNILKYGIIEKYIKEIFARREFMYNELVKVQKNSIEEVEYVNYLKTLMLIKNAAYIKVPFSGAAETKSLNITDIQKVPKLYDKFFSLIEDNVIKSIPGLNKNIIRMAMKANCRQENTELEDASARFLYIMSSRFQEYKHFDKIDRGAETPDKSWFNIAKKNAEFQGYDKRMIDELYKISADNSW
ncbi:MAG: hypothetical protein KKH98_13425 [Spirochaetes bacterium]|nr:hypothetical protein [Spirochaetota bacterium]